MRYSEIITEMPENIPLFHDRSANTALKILKNGFISGMTDQTMNGKTYMGISTSRSSRFDSVDVGNGKSDIHGRVGIQKHEVVFVLNQNALKRKYKIIPLDWFALNDTTEKKNT